MNFRIWLAPLALTLALGCGDGTTDPVDMGPEPDEGMEVMRDDGMGDMRDDGMPPDDTGVDSGMEVGEDMGPPGPDVSAQIQDARDAPAGVLDPAVAIGDATSGAVVTYTRLQVGTDPEGFFVQASQDGPALFVAVDLDALPTPPVVGDRVSFEVTETEVTALERQHRVIAISNFLRVSQGNDVAGLVQDITDVDVPTELDNLESELVTITAMIVDDPDVEDEPEGCGSNQSCFRMTTVGVTDGTDQLRIRGLTDLLDEEDLAVGCMATFGPVPMWRSAGNAQPLVLNPAEIDVTSCNGPVLLSAIATGPSTVVLTFDRFVDPGSIVDRTSQFTIQFEGGQLNVNAHLVDEREIILTTSGMTKGLAYMINVAAAGTPAPIADTIGGELQMGENAGAFLGYDEYIVINEVDYDQGETDDGEFIEIWNNSDEELDITQMSARIRVPGMRGHVTYASASLIDNSEGNTTLAVGDFMLILTANSDDVTVPTGVATVDMLDDGVLSDIPDDRGGVELRDSGGGFGCQDAVYWGGTPPGMSCFEGRAFDDTATESLARDDDGTDTDNNTTDFTLEDTITPGEVNPAP